MSPEVLVLSSLFPRPGRPLFGSFVFEQARLLPRLGVAARVVVPVARHERWRRRADEDVGPAPADPLLPVDHLPWLQLPGNAGLLPSGWVLYRRLRRHLRRQRMSPALIHAHDALPAGHAAWLLNRALGIPYVVTVHGRDAFFARQLAGVGLSAPGGQVARRVLAGAAAVVCVSDVVADIVRDGLGGGGDVRVVYNGFDPALFHPGAGCREEGFETLLSVGNLHRTKGQHLVIEALPRIRAAFPRVRYLVVGEGSYRAELEALARARGVADHVAFLGRRSRDAVARLMAAADLFVLPSYDEAFGCVYVEAMGSGTPVIACAGQGGALIVDDGASGLLVEPTPETVAAAVLRLLKDDALRRRLGRAALEKARAVFTWEASARALVSVYGEVTGAGSQGADAAAAAARTSAAGL